MHEGKPTTSCHQAAVRPQSEAVKLTCGIPIGSGIRSSPQQAHYRSHRGKVDRTAGVPCALPNFADWRSGTVGHIWASASTRAINLGSNTADSNEAGYQ